MRHCYIVRTIHGNSSICMKEKGLVEMKKYLREKYPTSKIAILTDHHVAELFHDKIKKTFPEAVLMIVEASEKSKSMKTAEQLCADLLEHHFKRNDVLIGLGGGMVTDLAGFVASIYMRGIHYMAMPTSLLAMIDASVGGKTGVNLGAKNVVGTIYPAEMIMIDLDFLKTLPERQLKTGVAEVIKYMAVLEPKLEKTLLAGEMDFIEILEKGLKTKTEICNRDLKEKGLRKALNFGHTFGHALEQLSKFKLTHGEAISIGMMLANKVAQKLGVQSSKTGDRVEKLLKKYDLPTQLPKNLSAEKLIELIYHDKKMEGGDVTFILCTTIGKHKMVKLKPKELMKLIK